MISFAGEWKIGEMIRAALHHYADNLMRRSRAIPLALHRKMRTIARVWLGLVLLLSLPRMLFAASPVHGLGDAAQIVLPYVLIALAPILGFMIAARSFPTGILTAQPDLRLSLYGKWQRLTVIDAKSHPAFGPAGFMASMLIGLLINVVLRTFEFMLAVPAMNAHAPQWGQMLFHLMAADVVVMSFFYSVCFVLALRSVPYFPRMLLFAWGLDITAQLAIAKQVAAMPHLPHMVAEPLLDLLQGNITKVLISAFVWLPYLILSERVNVTYRQRTRLPVAAG